jgi:hypothetical protein
LPTSQADVTALRDRNASVVSLAKRALSRFWGTLDLTRPEAARDALLEFMPELVATYGQAAATVAASWYEDLRARDVAGRYAAKLADSAGLEQVQKSTRYQAGALFTDNPGTMLAVLGDSVQRFVVNTSRDTIRGNAFRDKAKPTYARVPQGKTCAFCTLLASRGFVYATRESAGEFDKYHKKCDCTAVASFTDEADIPDYKPGDLYNLYQSARAASGATDIKSIAFEMRRQHPDLFTDGVVSSD